MNPILKGCLLGSLMVPCLSITSSGQTPLQFNAITPLDPGQLMFELQGPTNRTLIIESSTNLLDWRFLWEATPESVPPTGLVSSTLDLGQDAENVYLRAVYIGAVSNPEPLLALEGNATSSANDVLPNLGMPSPDPNRIDVSDGGLPVSLPDILATLADNTTVQQINDLLSAEGLVIAGVLNDMNLLLLCDQSIDSRSALRARINQLKSTGLFSSLAPNIGMDIPTDPTPATPTLSSVGSPGAQPSWTWDVTPLGQGTGGNNAFELSRIPQLWNWLDYGHRQNELFGGHRLTVVEFAFYTGHEDLPEAVQLLSGNDVSIRKRRHGTAVTGVVAAERNNDFGVEGVTPLLGSLEGIGKNFVTGWSFSLTSSDLELLSELLTRPAADRPRVINMSYGFTYTNAPTAEDIEWVDDLGEVMADGLEDLNSEHGGDYLIFCAAGNSSGVDARYNSPMANIACRTDLSARVPNLMTVESVDSNAVTSAFSNRDIVTAGDEPGHSISAGGEAVTTFSGPGASVYDAAGNGTSYASPLAAGVASFLWTLEPSLSVENIKFLLSNADTSMDVANGANLIDAFASALQIDRLRNGDPLQKALVDVDDGTLDGNLRKDLPVHFSEEPDKIHTYDGRRGDGLVDMRDFRVFRDAWLQVTGQTNHLDGSPTHFKRDLNGDGRVFDQPVSPPHPAPYYNHVGASAPPLPEEVYSRFDFNGNGLLDAENRSASPPTNSLAPFKVDPDTPVTGRSIANGFYRDIDVMLRPEIWDVNDEHVVLSGAPSYPNFLPDDWTTNNMSTLTVSYLHSFDFHIDMDGGNQGARDISYDEYPFQPVKEGLEIRSYFSEKKGRFSEWEGVATIPFNEIGEFPVISVAYRITDGDEFRQYFFHLLPKAGEDISLTLAFNDLQLQSNTRDFASFDVSGAGNPQSTEAIGKTPGSGSYGIIVIPREEATGEAIGNQAREAAVDALAGRLKFPVALNGSPSLVPIYDTTADQNGDVIVNIYGLKAHYNVIEGLPVTP